MKRVVLVSEAKVFGGAEVYLQGLAQSFTAWEPEIALPDRKSLAVWRGALERAGIATRPYAPTPAGWLGLLRELRAAAPDLVHLNLPNTYDGGSGLTAMALRAGTGRPVVTTEHLTRLPRSRRRRLVKLAARRAVSAVLVATRSSRETLVAEGLPADAIEVVPNGVVDPGAPRPMPEGGTLRIGFLATLEPRKHAELLVQVMAALPDVSLQLTLGGDGPLRPALERLAERLGQAHRVRFAGWVDDAASFLAAHHVLALPSRLEGMPLILLDAFAAGRGVLVTDLPGLDEVVEEGMTGRRLPLDDVKTWTDAVRDLAQDSARIERWGSEARADYERRFTALRAAAETEAVYDRVLAAEGNRG